MANTTPSPYMDLQIPTPAVAPGPEWATLLNECLLRIDQHTHIPGNGFPLSSNSLTINSDLPFNSNNATLLRSVRFINNLSVIGTPSDLGCIYQKGGDFYYNNSTGTPVQITNGTGVAGSPGSIGSLVAPASVNYVSASSTFVFQSAANTAANLDARSLTLRNSTVSSFGYTLSAPNAIASDTFITLPNLPATTNVMTLSATGVMNSVSYDFVGQSMSSVGANAIADTRTRATGSTVLAGGVAISGSSTSWVNSTTAENPVSNLSVTITTTGRPVYVLMTADGNASNFASNVYSNNTSQATTGAIISFWRDGAKIFSNALAMHTANSGVASIGISVPPSSFQIIDTPAAGLHTYVVKGAGADLLNNNIGVSYCRLMAYEL